MNRPLSAESIVAWADAFHARVGQWPIITEKTPWEQHLIEQEILNLIDPPFEDADYWRGDAEDFEDADHWRGDSDGEDFEESY